MDLVDIIGSTFDYLLELPDRVKKCVHEQITHEKRNNLIEYKRKKAADDFDETATLFECLKSHYHLIEPEKSINAIRYAYSPDIRYFVISYCKARSKIYVPSGVEQQEICLGGLNAYTLPDCWELKCTEQTISATTFEEYKKYLDGILKQYKNLEQSKWEKNSQRKKKKIYFK